MKNTRVKVAVRMRPLIPSEAKRGEKHSDNISPDGNGIL